MTSNVRCLGKPSVSPDGIACSCGEVFSLGSAEFRAAQYLAHRHGRRMSATEAMFRAEANPKVPDDKPPLTTVTVQHTKGGVITFEKCEGSMWSNGIFHIYQDDGTEVQFPKRVVARITIVEGSSPLLTDEQERRRDQVLQDLKDWQPGMNQRLDDLGPLEPGI